jgi:hypothetical protein
MPIVDAERKARNIPWQLQRLFYEMQVAPASWVTALDTKPLIKSFGWSEQEMCVVLANSRGDCFSAKIFI